MPGLFIWPCDLENQDSSTAEVPVIGGHAGVTIMPVFSQDSRSAGDHETQHHASGHEASEGFTYPFGLDDRQKGSWSIYQYTILGFVIGYGMAPVFAHQEKTYANLMVHLVPKLAIRPAVP